MMLKLCLVDRSAAKLSFVSLVLTLVDVVAIPLSVDMEPAEHLMQGPLDIHAFFLPKAQFLLEPISRFGCP